MTRMSRGRIARQQKVSHCHKRIRTVAQEITRASYEDLMSSSNEVYAQFKRQTEALTPSQREQRYVDLFWPKAIDAARATLTRLLTEPIAEALKEEIVEILSLDASLMRGRRNPSLVMGQLKS